MRHFTFPHDLGHDHLVSLEDALCFLLGEVAPLPLFLALVFDHRATDEGPGDLLRRLQRQVVEQQRVLAGEERLSFSDVLKAGLDRLMMEPIDEFVGDHHERVLREVGLEGEEPTLAVAQLIMKQN
jgi:hypothetical protein